MLGLPARAAAALLTGANLVQALAGFAANLLLARFILPEEFGRFAVVLATVNLALVMLSLRVNVLIIRCPPQSLDDRRRSVYHSISVIETVAVCLMAALWLGIVENGGALEMSLLSAIGLGHWLNLNKAFVERTLTYGAIAGCETGAALSGHALSAGAVLAGMGAVALYLREVASALIQAVALARAGALTLPPLVRPTAAEWREVLAESREVWADGVLEGAFSRLVVVGTAVLGGERAAGLLAQAQRLAVVPHQVLSPVATRLAAAWFGSIADPARRAAGRRRLVFLAAPPLAAAGLGAAAFADPVVPWLFGAPWHDAAPLLAALAGSVVFVTLFEINRAYALTGRHTAVLMTARLAQYGGLAAGPALAADPALGAALGLSAAAVLAFTTTEILLRRAEEA